ncbi:MAG: hypothetical protein ACOC1P_04520, partial [Minisyncoccales bacterium]
QDEVAYSIFENKLDYTFFDNEKCSQETFNKITQDLYENGQIMGELENKFGKDHDIVLQRKRFYSLVEVEHLDFLQLYEEKCDFEANYILFFYSNDEKKVDLSNKAGRLLGNIRENNENTYVYSFDVNLGTEIIEKLKDKYNVTSSSAPVAVVNGEEHIDDFNNIDNIEEHLD